MSDNIVPFTGKSSVLSKATQTMSDWFKDNNVPDIIAELPLSLNTKHNRELLPDNLLENIFYGISTDEGNGAVMFIGSGIRKKLIPEFGTKDHTKFIQIRWMSIDVRDSVVSFSDDLTQKLKDYFNSYPEVANGNNVAFCYSFLNAIEQNIRFRCVRLEFDEEDNFHKDKFVIGLTEDGKEQSLLFLLVIDFLPILLDDCAMRFWEEKLKDKP